MYVLGKSLAADLRRQAYHTLLRTYFVTDRAMLLLCVLTRLKATDYCMTTSVIGINLEHDPVMKVIQPNLQIKYLSKWVEFRKSSQLDCTRYFCVACLSLIHI